jgi:hypothetical protein
MRKIMKRRRTNGVSTRVPAPARVMPDKSWFGVTGWVWSYKWQEFLRHSSYLEREIYIWLDTDPRVVRFQPEPYKVYYRDAEGKDHSYTPDVLVHYVDVPCAVLAEIKWSRDLRTQHAENLVKFRAASAYAADNGNKFTIFTESRIENQEYRNRKFLRQFREQPAVATHERQAVLLDALKVMRRPTIDELLRRLGGNRENQLSCLRTIWHLLALGKIVTELKQPLRRQSTICL